MTTDATEPHGQDDITTPQGDAHTTPQGTPTSADVDTGTEVNDIDWKRESRKHEADKKKARAELAELRKKLEQMVSPDAVESVEAIAQSEKAARAAAEKETLRWRVAVEKGLTANQAKRLVGDTEEELLADADALVAELAPAKKAQAAKDGSNASPGKPNLSPAELMKAAAFGA